MGQTDGEIRFSASHVVEYAYRRSVGAVLGRFFTRPARAPPIGDAHARRPGAGAAPASTIPRPARRVDEFVDGRPRRRRDDWAWVDDAARRSTRSSGPSPGRSSASTAPTRRCCTPSTPARERACGPACACGRAGAPSASATSTTSSASSRRPSDERRRARQEHRDARSRLELRLPAAGAATRASCAGSREGRSSASAARVSQGLRAAARRVPDAAACRRPTRSRCSATRDRHHLLHRPRAVRRPSTWSCPTSRAHVLLDGADIPFFASSRIAPLEEVRMGMRVEAVWAPPRSWARRSRASLLPADRRAGRALRAATRSTSDARRRGRLVRAVAYVRRGAERNEVEMLMPVVGEAIERSGIPQGDRLHVLGQLRLPRGPAVRLRRGRSTRSARGRRSTSRTSRWTAPGRSTKRG